jgi:hypothetical protein
VSYNFYGTTEKLSPIPKEKTIILKIKGEVYSIKLAPLIEINKNLFQVPVLIINDNVSFPTTVDLEGNFEFNGKDAEEMSELFKRKLIEQIKVFIIEKKRKKIVEDFKERLNKFTLEESDIVVEEL